MAGPNYSIMTAFNARDNVTKAFDAMGRSAGRFSNNARSAFNQAGRSASQFDDRTSSAFRNSTKEGYKFLTIVKGILAANAIRGGLGMIGNGARKVATDFLSFDDTIIGAISRFDDLGPAAAKNLGIVASVEKRVRDSIVGSRFPAVDAAAATNELAKAGYESEIAFGMLRKQMDFATAGQENLAEATTMSSDLLGAFGLRSKDVQQQLKNHVELNDMLTKSSLLSTGGLRDMYETMQTVAPLSKELGMSKQEALALGVVLTNAGIKGTEAATAIKRASLNIFAGGMKEELAANGINISDAKTGELRKFSVILGEIGAKLAPLREDVKLPILRKLFGMYGLGGSFKLLQGFRDIDEFENKIADSRGVTKDVADAQNMSTFAKVVMLANTALEKGFQVLEKFNGDSQHGLIALTDKIRAFDVNPLVDGLRATGKVLGFAWTVLSPFLPAVPYLAASWMAWNVALKVFAAYKTAAIIWQIGAALTAGLGPVGAMTTAMGALGVAMAPVATAALALAALGSVGAAGYSLFTGKDNIISQLAQRAGLVPELETNADGKITGPKAPNTKEAEAKRLGTFMGRLDIAGAPPGSKLTTKSTGAPGFQMHMLGANP